MAKAAGIILGGIGLALVIVHFKNQNAPAIVPTTAPNNNNNTTNLLNPSPGALLSYSGLTAAEQNAGFTDLTNMAGYADCLAYLQATVRTYLFRSGWLLISNWTNYQPSVSLSQIMLYRAGYSPLKIYQAHTDAFSVMAILLQETPDPAPPSVASVDWSNPPQDVVYFLTGYQFLDTTDTATIAGLAQQQGLSVDQLLVQQCFAQNRTVQEYLANPIAVPLTNNTGGAVHVQNLNRLV